MVTLINILIFTYKKCDMTNIPQLIRDLSKKNRDRIEKSKKIAGAMIKTAEAAKGAAIKK